MNRKTSPLRVDRKPDGIGNTIRGVEMLTSSFDAFKVMVCFPSTASWIVSYCEEEDMCFCLVDARFMQKATNIMLDLSVETTLCLTSFGLGGRVLRAARVAMTQN